MYTWLNPLKNMHNKCFEDVVKTGTIKLFVYFQNLSFVAYHEKINYIYLNVMIMFYKLQYYPF